MEMKKYSAFTLVEMLIVMGILIILMAVGITAGRFAINRANDVAHQNAADQIYTAVQAYYTDHQEFPDLVDLEASMTDGCEAPTGGGDDLCLDSYMTEGEFTGGTDATFYYYVDGDVQQKLLVCVSKGGFDDETHRGFYCTGNAFDSATSGPGSITTKDVASDGDDVVPGGQTGWTLVQDWNGTEKSWGTAEAQ